MSKFFQLVQHKRNRHQTSTNTGLFFVPCRSPLYLSIKISRHYPIDIQKNQMFLPGQPVPKKKVQRSLPFPDPTPSELTSFAETPADLELPLCESSCFGGLLIHLSTMGPRRGFLPVDLKIFEVPKEGMVNHGEAVPEVG